MSSDRPQIEPLDSKPDSTISFDEYAQLATRLTSGIVQAETKSPAAKNTQNFPTAAIKDVSQNLASMSRQALISAQNVFVELDKPAADLKQIPQHFQGVVTYVNNVSNVVAANIISQSAEAQQN